MLTLDKVEELRRLVNKECLLLGDVHCAEKEEYKGIDVAYFVKKMEESRKAEVVKENRFLVLCTLFSPALCYLLFWLMKIPFLVNVGIFLALLVATNGYLMYIASKIVQPDAQKALAVTVNQETLKHRYHRDLTFLWNAVDYNDCEVIALTQGQDSVYDVKVRRPEGEEGFDSIYIPARYGEVLQEGKPLVLEDINTDDFGAELKGEYAEIVAELRK